MADAFTPPDPVQPWDAGPVPPGTTTVPADHAVSDGQPGACLARGASSRPFSRPCAAAGPTSASTSSRPSSPACAASRSTAPTTAATPSRTPSPANTSAGATTAPTGTLLQGIRNVAGPDVFALDDLGRLTLAAQHDDRTVVTDDAAGMFAVATGDVLIAGPDAHLAPTHYQDWIHAAR
ncbi:hypothetical protein [Micromonospora rhizosphaerae]|uniref:hypothetical protein n=1 Tax=Micromonospora rhizosphaerae TaxID=568872 RepID=UPI001FDF84E5|nr:hypothetical protein [Micromonospora rhizosphaerae]